MLGLIGYNFLADGNALDPISINVSDINNIILQNGVFNHINLTQDVTSAMSTTIPSDWSNATILDCNFENNISGGSLDNITQNVTSIKIKRKKINEYNWITIKEIPINSAEDFTFAFNDMIAISGTEYEYAYVPITGNIEGAYNIAKIKTNFRGVFICDAETAYRFYTGVEYGTTTTVQKIGVFEPFGRKYPIIISNGITGYDSGSFSGHIFPPSYYNENGIPNRQEIVEERNLIINFLTNKKPKILKDHNGNCWLICIVDSPNTSYDNNYGMGVIKTEANWVEIGDKNNAKDLYNAGLVPTEE